jgi:hypothetical protein
LSASLRKRSQQRFWDKTLPVEQLFQEDILDMTNYVSEENTLNAHTMKKFGNSYPSDIFRISI